MGLAQAWPPGVVLSFSVYFFFRLIPWDAGVLRVHFSARASKTYMRSEYGGPQHPKGSA